MLSVFLLSFVLYYTVLLDMVFGHIIRRNSNRQKNLFGGVDDKLTSLSRAMWTNPYRICRRYISRAFFNGYTYLFRSHPSQDFPYYYDREHLFRLHPASVQLPWFWRWRDVDRAWFVRAGPETLRSPRSRLILPIPAVAFSDSGTCPWGIMSEFVNFFLKKLPSHDLCAGTVLIGTNSVHISDNPGAVTRAVERNQGPRAPLYESNS